MRKKMIDNQEYDTLLEIADTILLNAIFEDNNKQTSCYCRKNMQKGDIVIAYDDLMGIAYDCEITEINDAWIYLKKLKVNGFFYNNIQEEYKKYNNSMNRKI
jgi:hypothetical protein